MIDKISVQYIKGVGPKVSGYLSKLGILTVRDLLWFFPARYEDRRKIYSITELKPNNYYQIKAKVLRIDKSRSSHRIIKALLTDETGSIVATWFNQPYVAEILSLGEEYIFYGRVVKNSVFGWSIVCPEIETFNKENESFSSVGRILPVYPLGIVSKNISQKKFRKIVFGALDKYSCQIRDNISEIVGGRIQLLPVQEALWEIHFPSSKDTLKKAKERFIFDEFFLFSLFIEKKKQAQRLVKIRKYYLPNKVVEEFSKRLPFCFTDSQLKAIDEICRDLLSPTVMHRLLQGDVGSGKTAVAFYCAGVALGSGYQVAMMVPTEILAMQHYNKAKDYFSDLVEVKLLVGSTKKKEKQEILQQIKQSKPVLVIGTHSLIEDEVEFANLGLVIIDEQHRFGVRQRVKLAQKSPSVDILVMTATPIPRSLAMTLYGDLDLTIIKGLPPGRKPVETIWITSDKRNRLYEFIRKRVKEGRQVYIIYPLVNESDEIDLLAAEQMYELLSKTVFPDLRVGLLHGKMKAKEKAKIMRDFYNGLIEILVATVVVEVGIDVPNATVMVIEHAERFGLSQLHQLRGRIGRGTHKSYCVVVSDSENPDTKKRLSVFVKYNDGFKLSEADLVLRGPGEFVGERQHGPTEFRVGNPITDFSILKQAKAIASSVLNTQERKAFQLLINQLDRLS